jgi:hypothetical protein
MSMPSMRLLVVPLALVCVVGCSHGPVRVDCERHLVPINAPARAAPTVEHEAGEKPKPSGGQQ